MTESRPPRATAEGTQAGGRDRGVRAVAEGLRVRDDRQDRQAHLEGHRATGQQHGATTLRLDEATATAALARETKREEMPRASNSFEFAVAFIAPKPTIDST